MNEGNATPSACFHTVSTNVPRSLWSVTLHFVLIAKIQKMAGRSLIIPCLTRLMMLGRIWTTLAGAVLCGSTLLRCGVGDRCCAISEGERHSHQTRSRQEQCGRRRRPLPLADALQATVLACGHMSFQECASCCHRCRCAKWCELLASLSCCLVCVAASVFFCFLGGKRCVARSIGLRVVLKLMWHGSRVELDSSSLSPLARALLQSATTSLSIDQFAT